MAQVPRDNNFIPTLAAALNTDGTTVVAVCASPTVHSICTVDGATGSDFSITDASRDGNRVPVLMAVSSADGVTPVEVYADSSGNLLIKST